MCITSIPYRVQCTDTRISPNKLGTARSLAYQRVCPPVLFSGCLIMSTYLDAIRDPCLFASGFTLDLND
jgi:hypothetical protein